MPTIAEDAPWRAKSKGVNLDGSDSDNWAETSTDASSPAKAALERARQAAAGVAKSATSAVEGVASEASAVAGKTLASRKKKIAIKQRPTEQKQTKLFLDVPDSELPPLSLLDAPEPKRNWLNSESPWKW
jgi:hypothetical protein